MKEIRAIRARRVSADAITEIVVGNEPVVFYAGKSDSLLRAYGLPINDWKQAIWITYGETPPLRVGREGLTEETLLHLLANQVDREWQPCRYGVLEVGSKHKRDVLYLVPDNAPWREAVAGKSPCVLAEGEQ
jgi:hypothetical protein